MLIEPAQPKNEFLFRSEDEDLFFLEIAR